LAQDIEVGWFLSWCWYRYIIIYKGCIFGTKSEGTHYWYYCL